MRLINTTDRRVDISGIDNHQMTGLKIVTAGAVIPTQRGDSIGIFHQYAYVPQGKTIHSCIQLESFGITVDDRSKVLQSGQQRITTPEGYVMPLDFYSGLPYLPMRPYTNTEWDTLPHVVFTSDVDWDPSTTNCRVSDNDDWFQEIPDNVSPIHVNTCTFRLDFHQPIQSNATHTKPAPRTFERYQDFFLRASTDVIRHTFDATTQFARSGWITGRIYDTRRSPFPALNVTRRNEAVATDTFFSPTAAIDNGSTCAQFFVGTSTKYVEVHGMHTDSQFIRTLWDTICTNGAMDTLVSDRAQV